MKHFENVIGCDSIKIELERILDIMANKEKYEKLGVKLPKTYLLYGQPGMGKTLIANDFIKASGRKSFICRKNKPNGTFIKEIKNIFEQAKNNQPSIVFLDDMDKFANEDDYHSDAEEYVTIQSCLDELKNQDVFVIATVNEMHKLPGSLIRAGRFGKKSEVRTPTKEDSEKIIKYYLQSKNVDENIDVKEIARITNYSSCAELEEIINEAGVFAGFDNKEKIDMDDIVRACVRLYFDAPEDLGKKNPKVLEQIAYHEAGHAVISEILNSDSVGIVSICVSTGNIGGITGKGYDDEDYWISKEKMENHVMCLLGGKASTEIVYGQIDIGVESDIKRAYRIVRRFVDDYCSYGFNKHRFSDPSNNLLERIENDVALEIEKYYQKAKKILVENREFLDKIAQTLIEKTTITSKTIQEIRKTCKINVVK